MSNIETLKELKDRGLLKPLVMSGIISPAIVAKMEMYYAVDARVRTGSKKDKAVIAVACELKACRATVYNAIRSLG